MPPVPIVDSHVHLWDPDKVEIPWLSNVPPINVKRDLDDYAQATSGLDVQGLVYLQVEVAPPYALLEARDLVNLARSDKRVMGVVPWAPLEYGDKVRYFLEEIAAIGPEIKGIRRIVQDEPDPEFCLHPRYIEGTRALPDFGLTADLCCNFRQLGPTVELVRQCPNTQFILDHIAKPNIRGGEMEPWAGQMRDLASLPNAMCKISGVATEANHESWTIDEIRPYVMHALEAFGEDRVVFGSDWPVCTLATPYRRWVETLDELTADWTAAAKAKLWRDNSIRFYRLDA
jgi:predicted TIM-barrel fold metal-dependent hydrolase